MKSTSPFLLALLLSVVSPVWGQKDPFLKENAPPVEPGSSAGTGEIGSLLITVETYAAPAVEIDRLLSAGLNASELRGGLIELEKSGKGRLHWIGALPCRSGQRAIISSLNKVFYIEPRTADTKVPVVKERECGDELEIDPVVSFDQQVIDMNLRLTDSSLAGFQSAGPDIVPSVLPTLESGDLTLSSTSAMGDYSLIGSYTRNTDQGLETMVALTRGRIAEQIPTVATIDSSDSGPATWQLVFRVFELDRTEARDLLHTHIDGDALYSAVTSSVSAGNASLIQMATITSKSGQRAKSEGQQKDAFKSPGIPGDERPAFEKSELGWVVEVDPVIRNDGKHVSLNFAASDSELVSVLKGHPALEAVPPTPIYSNCSTRTKIEFPFGQQTLGGTFNRPRQSAITDSADDGKTRFLFVEARTH